MAKPVAAKQNGMSIQKEHFQDCLMSDCYIGGAGEYLFVAQKPKPYGDPFEFTDFRCIFYRNGKWESKLVCHDIGLTGGYTSFPDKAWVMVSFFGSVVRFEQNSGKWEDDIPPHPSFNKTIIAMAKVISGRMFAVSDWRLALRRDGINKWTILDNGIPDPAELDPNSEEGFSVIDGFSENDIYAAGLCADVWHWNGVIWKQIELPTNVDIYSICCGGDGLVYISTGVRTIWVGRNNKWKAIKYDQEIKFVNMTWFKDRIYMAYAGTLYEIKDGKFQESELNSHKDKPADCSFIDANDEVMLMGSKLEIATFDGKEFTTIMPFEMVAAK